MPEFEFVHLESIKLYIVWQVITRIGTGHHPGRQICDDDITRHLQRGAQLFRLFAELGNFFPSCNLLFSPLVICSASGPARFLHFLFKSADMVVIQRSRCWSLQGIQSALQLLLIYLLLRRWIFFLKKASTSPLE